MKIMISQPMRGKTNEQIREERTELIKQLEAEGHKVIDTILTNEAPIETSQPIYYLGKSLELMSTVDAVVFMKGWENARGCKIEYEVAKNYGKFIREE